jgi:hypothetical protein
MTMLIEPMPLGRTSKKARSIFDCEPRFRQVKAVRVTVRVQSLRHPPLSRSFAGRSARRTTSSWSRQ